MATRRYFKSSESWTADRDDAYDFGLAAKAVRLARKLRVPNLEVVLSFDDQEPAAATPFERFLLGVVCQNRRQVAGSGA